MGICWGQQKTGKPEPTFRDRGLQGGPGPAVQPEACISAGSISQGPHSHSEPLYPSGLFDCDRLVVLLVDLLLSNPLFLPVLALSLCKFSATLGHQVTQRLSQSIWWSLQTSSLPSCHFHKFTHSKSLPPSGSFHHPLPSLNVSLQGRARHSAPPWPISVHTPLPLCSPLPNWENSSLGKEVGVGGNYVSVSGFLPNLFFMLWVFLIVPEA